MSEFRKLNDIIMIDKIDSKKLFYREACRGIIFDKGKIVVLKSKKYGDFIIPGGGVNPGESYIDALKREVLEESGILIKNPVPFSVITEYRKPLETDLELFVMKSFNYLCEIDQENLPTHMEQYELEYGYEVIKTSLNEVIDNNHKLLKEAKHPIWTLRETKVLEDLRTYLSKKST